MNLHIHNKGRGSSPGTIPSGAEDGDLLITSSAVALSPKATIFGDAAAIRASAAIASKSANETVVQWCCHGMYLLMQQHGAASWKPAPLVGRAV